MSILEKIKAALEKLDPTNDGHWVDGKPRVEAVRLLAADQKITSEQIAEASPAYTRDNPSHDALPPSQEPSNASTTAPPSVSGDALSTAQPQQPTDQAAAIASAQGRLDAARLGKVAADQELAQAAQALDLLLTIDPPKPESISDQLAQYYARQKANLEERGKRILAVAKTDLSHILPKRAPIDSAMANKNTRGTSRPDVPRIDNTPPQA